MWKIRRKKRIDDDPRPYVTKDISPDEFAKVYDMTFQYREKVQPEAFTLEFWEKILFMVSNSKFLRLKVGITTETVFFIIIHLPTFFIFSYISNSKNRPSLLEMEHFYPARKG